MKNLYNTGLIRVEPGQKVRLRDIDPESSGEYLSKEQAAPRHAKLLSQLKELQTALYAEHQRSVLIVIQAMDTGGKDGAVKSLMSGINPAGVRETSFKVPNAKELSFDFLWRCHQAVPPKGHIGVWNRSHYEDVLVVRIHDLIDKKTCKQRFEHINNFEKLLSDNGTMVLKFFLHISKDEQKKRLQARLDNPEKWWKFNTGDLKERAYWDDYQAAYEDVFNSCSTEYAPWHIVPANRKWARDIALAEAVVTALEKQDYKYPKADFDPSKIVLE